MTLSWKHLQLVCKRCHYACLCWVFVTFTPFWPACFVLSALQIDSVDSKLQKALFLPSLTDLVIGPSFTHMVSGCLSVGFGENCVHVLCREREDPKSIAAPQSACLFPPMLNVWSLLCCKRYICTGTESLVWLLF